MAWPVILGKVAQTVGTALLFEYGDDIAAGIAGFFEDKEEAKKNPKQVAKSPDRQELQREVFREVSAQGLPKFNQEQAASAAAIARVCNVLEIYSPEQRKALCMALWVNAWHESRLRPGAHNPKGEDSRGLFQINVRAHPQWKSLDLYDPYKNTAGILLLALKQRQFLEAMESGSLAKLVYVVCRYVERPRNAHESALRRVATARTWYGNIVV